jgi:hypothetical protein
MDNGTSQKALPLAGLFLEHSPLADCASLFGGLLFAATCIEFETTPLELALFLSITNPRIKKPTVHNVINPLTTPTMSALFGSKLEKNVLRSSIRYKIKIIS